MTLSTQELLKRSEDLRKDADYVITQTKIYSILKSLGNVTCVGSYALDLLYRPDIDVFVQSETCTKENAIVTTKQFLDSGYFQTVGFVDWTEHDPPNKMRGFYWELVYYSKKYRWKFDVWYTSDINIESIRMTNVVSALLRKKQSAKLEILRLKDKYFDGIKYKDEMNGYKIYKKVLGNI